MKAAHVIRPKGLVRRLLLALLIIVGAVVMVFSGEMVIVAEEEEKNTDKKELKGVAQGLLEALARAYNFIEFSRYQQPTRSEFLNVLDELGKELDRSRPILS